MEILIGIIASFVASILWWGLSELYSFQARKIINYYIMLLRSENAAYEKFLKYEDYDLALQQSQKMLDEIGRIYYSIKRLTYSCKKRKLINTLLVNLNTNISRFQLYYKGYDNETEKKHCCYEARRHLFVVGYEAEDTNKYPDPDKFQSVSSVTINLLSYLNLYKFRSINKILTTSFCFYCSNVDIETRKKYYIDLVDANSFKDSYSKEVGTLFQISSDTYRREEYNNLIKKLK